MADVMRRNSRLCEKQLKDIFMLGDRLINSEII